MGIAERRERDKAGMREEILNAAREIIAADGVDSLSIRKIAGKIEYSPAIIYHYFQNKEEILEKLIAENYAQIVQSLAPLQSQEKRPAEKLREGARNFITLAVQMGDTYQSMMLNRSPAVLARTSVLQRGAAVERPAIAALCNTLREFPAFAGCDDAKLEATAQVIWSTAFGLALRLNVEQVEKEQRLTLIDSAVDFILLALEKEPKSDGGEEK